MITNSAQHMAAASSILVLFEVHSNAIGELAGAEEDHRDQVQDYHHLRVDRPTDRQPKVSVEYGAEPKAGIGDT